MIGAVERTVALKAVVGVLECQRGNDPILGALKNIVDSRKDGKLAGYP